MGNGVSVDQGNLPAHGKRDVRSGLGTKRHDWSEQARAREIVTSPPTPTYYNNNKYENTCTLDMIHVKKRHNTDCGTLLKCYPWS